MELWSFVTRFARRWRILVPGLVLTLVACAAVVITAKPNYEVSGALVVLLPSKVKNAEGQPVNPWFTADAAASQFAALMVSAVTGDEFAEKAEAKGVPETFVIAADTTRPAVVTLTVTAPSPAQAMDGYGRLVDEFRAEVSNRQVSLNAPEETRYSALDLVHPQEAKAVRTRVKLAIGLFGAGVMATLLLVALLELRAAVKRHRERGATAAAPAPAPIRSLSA